MATSSAAVRIAVDMVDEGIITPAEAVGRIEPGMVDQLLRDQFDPAVIDRDFFPFVQGMKRPELIVFHVVTLAFAVYHSYTWFQLTPKALPLQLGEKFLPDGVIAGAHFGYRILWILLPVTVALVVALATVTW